MEKFAQFALEALNAELPQPVDASSLETPPKPEMGDFGFPCFKLSKALRKAPPAIAAELAQAISKSGRLPAELSVSALGPYVNFTVEPTVLAQTVVGGLRQTTYGKLDANTRGNWVLEYSSPNVAKTLNIYHLRPTALGAALDRIARYRGYRVTAINHLGDWGKQYGMLAVAFEHFKIKPSLEMTMEELVDLYVKINAEAATDPTLDQRAREAFLKLEKGDPEITRVWRICYDISLKEFMRIYARLGVRFDHYWGESFYKDQLEPLLADLKSRGLLVESEGALVVPVEDESGKELPPCILKKSDGATIYATRDLAAAIYRAEHLKFDRMTYIVGGEQRLHFQQVFGVLRKMGLPWASKCEHIGFGLYRFKDAKMSTRKGNFVTLESVLDLAKERVFTLMKDRKASATDAIAEAVALGAVVFHDLKTDPVRDVEFDLESAVDFEGETGPYLQYAHTRCESILRKAQDLSPSIATPSAAEFDSLAKLLTAPAERILVKTLAQLPLHLERTIETSKASLLCHHLIDVTQHFGTFYRECRVLPASPTPDAQEIALSQARLALVDATRASLKLGLSLLGIPCPERM